MRIIQIITLVILCGAVTSMAFAEEEDKKKAAPLPVVRKLVLKPADRMLGLRFGGKSKMMLFKNVAEVEKLFGKEKAKPLLKLMDFKTNNLVFISWTTLGPPNGKLKYEIEQDEFGVELKFYVQAPADAKIRGMRARIGGDFFAVSKNCAVSFDAKERP